MLRLAALLHDLGKLAIPDSILKKPGRLTEDEWQIMRQHESMGADMIFQATGNGTLTEMVRYHHSWFGGTAHAPELPVGKDIPGPCRLLLIGDAYDALVSDRCYRKGTTHEAACGELRRCAGTQFDPDLVEAFIAQMDRTIRARQGLETLKNEDAAEALTALRRGVDEIAAEIGPVAGSPDKPCSLEPAVRPELIPSSVLTRLGPML